MSRFRRLSDRSADDAVLRALFAPPAPTGVTATRGNAQAVVSWTAPSVLAQTPITDYIVQFSTNSGSTYTTFADGTSTATTATVTGLTNGTAHVFRVAAVNALGAGAFSAASAAVTPVAGDALYTSVSLLLPMDGTGATFVDSSLTPKTITAVGNATQSTAQSKWGNKSAYFDGSGDAISIANHASLNLSNTTDFVIEGWAYPTANRANAALVAKRDGSNPTAYMLYFNNQYFGFYNGSVAVTGSIQGQLNQWSHFAAAYSGGVMRVYWNGALAGSQSLVVYEYDQPITIGRHFSSIEEAFIGYIDDLRITKGSARGYTGATITVPTAAFPTL